MKASLTASEWLPPKSDLALHLLADYLIWGRRVVSGECLRLGLADEVPYSILPILIGDGDTVLRKARTGRRSPVGRGESL